MVNDLPHEQLKLAQIAGKCMALKDRLEFHGFKLVKFQVTVSRDYANLPYAGFTYGIETKVTVDGTLPAGTINVAALVQ